MNISKEIKEQRIRLSLSQEELAEKVYVTRQTVSSWENDRSYPDIHSLILLSNTFEITIDQLVKGDLPEMKRLVEHDSDRRNIKRNRIIAVIGLPLCVTLLIITAHLYSLSMYLESIIAGGAAALIYVIGITFGIKGIKMIKKYDLQSLKEIIAFQNGETLDNIVEKRNGIKTMKRYQKVLILMAIALPVMVVYGWLLVQIAL